MTPRGKPKAPKLVTIKVSPEVHDELFSYAGEMQAQLGRRVTVDETLKDILEYMDKFGVEALIEKLEPSPSYPVKKSVNAAKHADEHKNVKGRARGRPSKRYISSKQPSQ